MSNLEISKNDDGVIRSIFLFSHDLKFSSHTGCVHLSLHSHNYFQNISKGDGKWNVLDDRVELY